MASAHAAPPSGTSVSQPELSVVMIAYNMERYIGQALDSVLMQEVDCAFEIVIGEDHSTDGTREIVRDYAQRHPDRIRPIFRQANLGMNRNFMETLLAARGRFVALLDSDDWWTTPHKLQKQLEFLRANPGFSICFHNALVVYEMGERPPHPFHMQEPQHLISHYVPKPVSTIDDLAGGNFMQTCSVMFRAGLYGTLPDWYLQMPTFDWPLHLLNAEHGSIAYIDEVMGAYRVHAAGFWSMNMALYRNIEDVESMIRGYELVDRYTRFRYTRKIHSQLLPLYRRASEVHLAGGKRWKAVRYALKGLLPLSRENRGGHRQALAMLQKVLTSRAS